MAWRGREKKEAPATVTLATSVFYYPPVLHFLRFREWESKEGVGGEDAPSSLLSTRSMAEEQPPQLIETLNSYVCMSAMAVCLRKRISFLCGADGRETIVFSVVVKAVQNDASCANGATQEGTGVA